MLTDKNNQPVTSWIFDMIWYFESHCYFPKKHPVRTSHIPLTSLYIITVMSLWPRWCLKSLASRLLTQAFVLEQIQENFNAPRHWLLWGKSTGGRSPHKGPVTRKTFPFGDVIMTRPLSKHGYADQSYVASSSNHIAQDVRNFSKSSSVTSSRIDVVLHMMYECTYDV